MFSKHVLISTLALAAVVAAVLTFDVSIRVRDATAASANDSADQWSRTKPYPKHDVYYPGTEELGADEIRVIACGSGIPMPRLKQASPCFLIELGNGDKFIFDMGVGAMERITSLGIPLDFIDKVFITHLHMDHMGDLPAFYILGPQNNRSVGLRVWGPGGGGSPEKWGMKAAMANMEKTWVWMTDTLVGTIDGRSFKLDVTEYDWS
jgi:ribonuclease Z